MLRGGCGWGRNQIGRLTEQGSFTFFSDPGIQSPKGIAPDTLTARGSGGTARSGLQVAGTKCLSMPKSPAVQLPTGRVTCIRPLMSEPHAEVELG